MSYEARITTKRILTCNCCKKETEIELGGLTYFFATHTGWIRNGKENFHVCPGCVKEFTDKSYEHPLIKSENFVTLDQTFLTNPRCTECDVMLGMAHAQGCRYFV